MEDTNKRLYTISITADLDETNIADMNVSIRDVIHEHFGVDVHSVRITPYTFNAINPEHILYNPPRK